MTSVARSTFGSDERSEKRYSTSSTAFLVQNEYRWGVEFNSSERSTLGVEIEYGLVDRESGELVPASVELLAEAAAPYGTDEHPKAKNELFLSSLEVITGICETVSEARADLATTLCELKPLLDKRGLGMESSGTHPFALWTDMQVTPNPRYQRMVDKLQWPATRLLIHGVHVHVGVRSGDKAVTTTNVLAVYLPLILALSCSSPYWLGEDTGMASARTKIFEGMPTTGVPPQLADWNEYNELLEALINAGTIETNKEIWWDVRPHPGFGTVELRMCDGIPTLQDTMTVAAIAQCLVTYVDDQVDAGHEFELLPDWVLRENKGRASRWGLDAKLITNRHGSTKPLRQWLEELIDLLTPYAQRLRCLDELNYAHTIARDGSSYLRQRAVVEQGGDLHDVVNLLLKEFDDDLARAAAELPADGSPSDSNESN